VQSAVLALVVRQKNTNLSLTGGGGAGEAMSSASAAWMAPSSARVLHAGCLVSSIVGYQ